MGISLICPCCHSRMTMQCLEFQGAKSEKKGDYYNLVDTKLEYGNFVDYKQYLYKCGNKNCNYIITTICRENEEDFVRTYPSLPEVFDFSSFNNIKNISPNFVDIFNKAYSVESLGYKEIAGPGYRKAMEYLVKDYAIYLVGDDKEKKERIMKEGIMDCINEYISDPDFQKLTKHTMWLGNDQVHYYQKRDDKDIDYLKEMIETAMNYIEMHLKMNKFSKDFDRDNS